jgi:quinolinate synthase
MILWDGSCMVHEIFSVKDLLAAKRRLPDAKTIAHPECPANIREHADFIGGTEAMVKYVGGFAGPTDFLVATEANMMWQLQSKHPRHRYHPVPGITCACNKCPHMARNTLEKLRDCLKNGEPEIHWQPEFDKAKEVLQRSLLNPAPPPAVPAAVAVEQGPDGD